MKISSPLNKILDNEAKVKILRFLIKTKTEWNGRQIAKEIGVTPATAHKALHGLYGEGILLLRNVGKTHIYSLKKDNYLVLNLLEPLFAKEGKVFDDIVESIRKKISRSSIKKAITSVVLFGSVNLHTDKPASDIDLAVLIKDAGNRQKVSKFFEDMDKKFSKEFGNTISTYINTEAEFKNKYKKGLGIIKNILKSSRLICGKELKEML